MNLSSRETIVLEIFILISLSRNIAAKAREKGRSGAPFVIMLLVLWIGGEVFAAVAAVVAVAIITGDEEPNLLIVYPAAIVGAIIGAVVAFQIMKAVAPARARGDDGDDYNDRRDRDADYDRY